MLNSSKDIAIENLPDALPPSEPCYAFLAWPHSYTAYPRREISEKKLSLHVILLTAVSSLYLFLPGNFPGQEPDDLLQRILVHFSGWRRYHSNFLAYGVHLSTQD